MGLLTPGDARLIAQLHIVEVLGLGGPLGAFFRAQSAVGVDLFLKTVHRRSGSRPGIRLALGVQGRCANLADGGSINHANMKPCTAFVFLHL